MFRKLYWVAEKVTSDGNSHVHGVYTSIPNLVRHCLQVCELRELRISLTKLDCEEAPFGTWQGPAFSGLLEAISPFVATEEFSRDHAQILRDTLVAQQTVAA